MGTEIKRATESVGPPAAKGTIKEIDLVGQAFCATADWLARSAPALAAASIPAKKDFLKFIEVSNLYVSAILPFFMVFLGALSLVFTSKRKGSLG
jgi:hypothetical protein